MRNVPNNGWITLGSFASGSFVPAGVNRLTEAQATDPTGTEFGAISGTQIAAAVDARMGAVGTPVNEAAWHPYDMVRVGDGATGLFYDSAVDGDVFPLQTPAFEDGYEYAFAFEAVTPTGSGTIEVRACSEANDTWSDVYPLSSEVTSRSRQCWGFLRVALPRVPSRILTLTWERPFYYLQSNRIFVGSAGGTSIDVELYNVDSKAGALRFSFSGSNGFRRGKVYCHRRREFISG
ncbi:hypothetical protein [Rhodovulum sulfidophilum]|uniref:hypothetical protein n=1 Tax=Rhodovulum sulfidophilum TaxID=35806 RepID=UPI0009525C66|nr:hypothetical protein [Rhodovulum sulfidophilum]OLS51833.1 hypothetical protein BV392_07320 [Rhodovulum sulfidophilum]